MTQTAPEFPRLGWTEELEKAFAAFAAEGLVPARVVAEHRAAYEVVSPGGAFMAEVSGAFRRAAGSKAGFPAVGDWAAVSYDPAARRQTIRGLLPRRTKLSRRDPGGEEEQVIAANIDLVFVVQGLDGDFNTKRLERYLAAATAGGAEAAVILNKADLDPAAAAARAAEVGAVAPGAPVLLLDSLSGAGYGALEPHIRAGRVILLAGSSGAGKSTIINNLMGSGVQRVGAVRADDSRGRHTTTGRRMFVLPGSGALLIDTPGMRGLELWAGGQTVEETFADIQALSGNCRFGDCAHTGEPGCAVLAALESGAMSRAHYDNYLKLRAETAYLKTKLDLEARLKKKAADRRLHMDIRDVNKRKRRPGPL